uniref:Large ribosomal subunit protein uL4c n=1 Tax=Nephromyces sp. ex Molgula occidentalis TaxID=2544991 RepID=A0A5C1H7H8_9APIC|nr:50S ribosomal protein L4 [Nephromyces sp. ex Molgula occidentalis]
MNQIKVLNKKILLFFPIRNFNNWVKFIKGTFIFKGKLDLYKYMYNKKKLFISDVINKENFLFKHQRSASIKHRGEVAHSNKKPRPQKGTGKARAGSFNSPIWRGGGVIFGPKPKFSKFKISHKQLKLSKFLLIFNKRNNILIIKFIKKFPFNSTSLVDHIKTQLLKVGISLHSNILLINTTFYNLKKEFNLLNIKIITHFNLLTSDLLFNDYIIIFI